MILAYSLIFTVLLHVSLGSSCPSKTVLAPCDCSDTDQGSFVHCGLNVTDLVPVFTRLSALGKDEKSFDSFTLRMSNVTELPANVFKDVLFKKFYFLMNDLLERIDQGAFNVTSSSIEMVSMENNVKLGVKEQDNVALFKALSSLSKVRSIDLAKNGFEEIPSHAFNSSQDYLLTLTIGGQSIKSIGSYPFSTLHNLTHLIIHETSISHFSPSSISFDPSGPSPNNIHIPIEIRFVKNHDLTGDSFRNTTNWVNITSLRPVTIQFVNPFPIVTYLDECAFAPLLKQNVNTTISVDSLDCANCENYWIVKEKYQDRVKETWTGCDDAADPKFAKCSTFSRTC